MTQIHFSQNCQDFLIPYEEKKNLCSVSDPQGEGLRWAYSFGSLPTKHIVIVGLGAGFHVAALADIHPDIRITVIDNRESLVPIFKAQFEDIQDRVEILIAQESRDLLQSDLYKEIVENRSFVLSFFESWGYQEEVLSTLFAHATGRTLESVRFHLSEMNMNLKAMNTASLELMTLPELLPAIESSDMNVDSKQIFKMLGELTQP